jgi:uncharacterized membrane protein
MEASGAGADRQPPKAILTQQEQEIAFNRVVAFTDGVFAIAITLLVLALEIPDEGSEVGTELVHQGDDFFAYLLSFAVLGRLWMTHHRFFASLARFDGPMMSLNLVYLAGIALVPFTSEVLGDYGNESAAVAVYGANLAVVSATFYVQVVYAFRKHLVREKFQPYARRYSGPANAIITVIFFLSIPVALLNPAAAIAFWVLTFAFGRRLIDWVTGVKSIQQPSD